MRLAESNESLRHEHGSVDPNLNKFPNSLCLHAIVSFSDNAVLAMRRGPDLAFEQQSYSLSFEEQFSDSDIRLGGVNHAADCWTKRALCEEVFPLKRMYQADPTRAWQLVTDYVAERRFLSLLYEETLAGYALVAHYRQNIRSVDFLDLYTHIKSLAAGDSVDPEGVLLVVNRKELQSLIETGDCQAASLRDLAITYNVMNRKLHKSSLYRAFAYSALLGDEIRNFPSGANTASQRA